VAGLASRTSSPAFAARLAAGVWVSDEIVFGESDPVFVDETKGALGEVPVWLAGEFCVAGATMAGTGAGDFALKKRYSATAMNNKIAARPRLFFI
jgi:hypothetical protein